jgi:hypothetical protein
MVSGGEKNRPQARHLRTVCCTNVLGMAKLELAKNEKSRSKTYQSN